MSTPASSPLLAVATSLFGATPSEPCYLDVSFDLTDPQAGRAAFEASHVPGAVHLDLDQDLCAPKTGRNGRHPLPSREQFAQTLGSLGLQPLHDVVVLDRGNAMFAARLWWMLLWAGHSRVRVLDGGHAAWVAAGGPTETGPGRPRRAEAPPYPLGEPKVRQVDANAVLAGLGRMRLIDARAPERFRGEVEPLDPVAGHIPGAMNLPFAGNLAADGRFLPPEALQARWAPALGAAPQDVVHQCGSGVTACHNLLASAAAGLPLGVLYPGSWSEWCSDTARPVVTSAGSP